MKPIMTRSAKLGSLFLATASFAAFPMMAVAEPGAENDPYGLLVGAYFVSQVNSQIRADRDLGPVAVGATIDWERDLGGDTTYTAPRVEAYYRFGRNHRVDISWYQIDLSANYLTQRDLSFGNINIPAGSSVASTFQFDTAKLAYTYSFYRAPEIETGISLGLHVSRAQAGITASGLGLSEAAEVTAPLPVLGFRIDYALTPKWWVRSKYELFFLDKVDEYRGSFQDFTLGIEHQTFRHLGFGFSLNRSSLDVEASDNAVHTAFNGVINGYHLYLVIR